MDEVHVYPSPSDEPADSLLHIRDDAELCAILQRIPRGVFGGNFGSFPVSFACHLPTDLYRLDTLQVCVQKDWPRSLLWFLSQGGMEPELLSSSLTHASTHNRYDCAVLLLERGGAVPDEAALSAALANGHVRLTALLLLGFGARVPPDRMLELVITKPGPHWPVLDFLVRNRHVTTPALLTRITDGVAGGSEQYTHFVETLERLDYPLHLDQESFHRIASLVPRNSDNGLLRYLRMQSERVHLAPGQAQDKCVGTPG